MNILRKKILVVGGAGYIGRHTIVELCASGYEVLVLDNFCKERLILSKEMLEINTY